MATVRQRIPNTASEAAASSNNEAPAPTTPTPAPRRNSPFLPTPIEQILLGIFPLILVFGTVFSLLSPDTRAAPYDHLSQAHDQDPALAPSYFARKNNVFNVYFVKRGWGWITFGFVFSLLMQPTGTKTPPEVVTARRLRAGVRWVIVTGWWFFVTQWFFGPPIIDRSFRWTGGRCELAQREVAMGDASLGEKLTAVACKAAGGRWKGGHDISGHVFLLVLGTGFLMQEVLWPALRRKRIQAEERSVVMTDGAVKSASVESATDSETFAPGPILNIGGKVAAGIMYLSLWMLLMTAIYFHTWFEKLTGLLTAFTALYSVYHVPRFVPALRQIVGMPGI